MGGFEQKPWTPTKRIGKISAEINTPGPACVQLPTLIGHKVKEGNKIASPAYSFGIPYKRKDISVGPGPASYDITKLGKTGKDTAPAVSLLARLKEMTKFSTPAPGEYNIDRAKNVVKDAPPKFTFGVKATMVKPFNTPGKKLEKE